jgi:hypothetical protein
MINLNEYIPELVSLNVMWEEVSNGLGSTKPHLKDVYVVYTKDDMVIGAILEDNGGLGFSFGDWISMSCEGSSVTTSERVIELTSIETFQAHQERMQTIITLLNTSPKVQKAQWEVYGFEENDGQPTEQKEWEDVEQESIYQED